MSNSDVRTVERIRASYTAREKTKFDELKELNKKVRLPAEVFSYAFGTVGALVLGTGMCLAMKVIGNLMVPGILIGLAGIAMVSTTYSIYKAILSSRKKKYAKQVLSLTDELLNK